MKMMLELPASVSGLKDRGKVIGRIEVERPDVCWVEIDVEFMREDEVVRLARRIGIR
jgi:hypothetical protein